jgi:sporulation protein YtfJ
VQKSFIIDIVLKTDLLRMKNLKNGGAKMANSLESMFSSTLRGLREMIDVNTVIGNPIETSDGTTIIPVTKVSFGFGMGGFNQEESIENEKIAGGGGGGVSVSPVGFLIVENGNIKMLNVDSATAFEKVIDSMPEIIKSIGSFFGKK